VTIGIVAGEASGDLLAAGLIHAFKAQYPDCTFVGISGPLMDAAGCQSLCSLEKLSVMGLVEVLANFPELKRIQKSVLTHFLNHPPDVFIGVDAPDFNLWIEKRLRAAGIQTMHYVSPSVWAWRQYRIKNIAQSVDHMLTLFPFEAAFYRRHEVPVTFVGHPLADDIPMVVDRTAARKSLGLSTEPVLIALLPGSRSAELQRLTQPFLETAYRCLQKRPECQFIAPMANEKMAALFHQGLQEFAIDLPITVVIGQARTAMAAADGVLLASGTATLEALLLKRPMVVSYAVSWVTYRVIKWLLKVKHVALSNLLTETPMVPEFIQKDICPEKMADSLLDVMSREKDFVAQFTQVHKDLRQGASERAADVLLSLVRHENH